MLEQPAAPREVCARPDATLEEPMRVIEVVCAALVAFAAIGIGVTDVSPYYGFWYWVAMVPVFGVATAWSTWPSGDASGATATGVLRTQAMHWVATLAAVHVVFILLRAGRMNNEDAGLVALLTLGLSTFLAGTYGDWRFCLVGLLLGLIAGAAGFVEQFLWMLLIPLIVIVALLGLWWFRSQRGASASSTPATPVP
jgi:hypothetical protein